MYLTTAEKILFAAIILITLVILAFCVKTFGFAFIVCTTLCLPIVVFVKTIS